ncbi:Trk system potassium uptake protein TrkA [Geminocystis sp. NIES-3708]|uniref:potassium channel family protein n=1 Tax=Geminocystis sp. NIES-3708 TaxID=1615909 RepID=UPI0005FC6623|nr:TrkA family potassium uptake protein [Geminocystis sp. NIES-3708]BAQ61959.1 Trk system potassium uptake protein TrkA [Geminocystis sp. NIES-3708]
MAINNQQPSNNSNQRFKNIFSLDLSSLKFLNNLRKESRQFGVIGLGRFGRAVCETLYNMGYDVLGVDVDEKLVAQALTDKIASSAIRLDCTEVSALKEAGILELDTVIVAIGNYLEESIITTLNVKEAGVKYIVAKASSTTHGKLLKKVGADLVVYPEHQAGCELAYTLTKPGILDRFELDPDNSIVEVSIPPEFDSKTLAEVKLRSHYGLNVLAVGNDDKFIINPPPNYVLTKGLSMVVIGSNKDINKL